MSVHHGFYRKEPPMPDKPYWTVEQFLKSGQCPYGRSTLYRLINEGKIPCIRHSRTVVIPKVAWGKYLETCGGTFATG